MTDRVLTVRQPWASAIFDSGKSVENRTWTTSYRGRLWIHAGLTVDEWAMLPGGHLPRGVILGHVDLVDVVTDSDSRWAEPWCFHWLLENPVAVDPFPHRGGQGLRRFDASHARVIKS